MASYLFLGVWLICGVVCFAIKHSLFDVYYTEGGVSARIGTDRSNQFVYGIVCDRSCRQTPVS